MLGRSGEAPGVVFTPEAVQIVNRLERFIFEAFGYGKRL